MSNEHNIFVFEDNSPLDSDLFLMDDSSLSMLIPDKENASIQDESDLSFYTPRKSTPNISAKRVLLPSARKSAYQSHIDRAYSCQEDTNKLLREIVGQQANILLALNRIADCLSKDN